MKLSVSALRGARTNNRPTSSATASASTTAATGYGSRASIATPFLPFQMDDEDGGEGGGVGGSSDRTMVDNTGIGPSGGTEPPISGVNATAGDGDGSRKSHRNAATTANVRQNNDLAGSAVAVKGSKGDQHRPNEKSQRTRSNQGWLKLRTTVQLSGAISSTIQKSKPQLKREDSFLKRFSTRQMPETQDTLDTGDDGDGSSSAGESEACRQLRRRKRRSRKKMRPSTVVHPDENFYFYWLLTLTASVLYNLWTLIVRQSFPEFQRMAQTFWTWCDNLTDLVFFFDIVVQFRTGYLEQGLVVYDSRKLALHYVRSRPFLLDLAALLPLQLLQLRIGTCPILRFPRFLKIYRVYNYYYMVESRTVYPNLWRVANLVHILLILAHWFGCFYYLLSEAEQFKGRWVFPKNATGNNTLTRKYLGSLYWSTLTLTTIGDLPTPETDAEFVFTIVSYLIGVFIFATIVGQVGNVITNRNANRLEFERLLDGAKTYMRHHKVPNGMKRRVLRWYDYSWSRGRIQGGGDINTALGLLPDKLKTELALHVNLSVLKKVTIFQECQPEFLHDLVLKMKAFIFTPGDLICRKGEVAREMFIIADGILEVISDTGHVLTTMMAGDFFGEIGILNLDGLNKRTADVRSVGYSELFSLSREDVLAAMKDYPEAQEILQSLGRKRLMEARSITKAIIEQKNQAKLNVMIQKAAQVAEHRSKNRIVEKIYSDVKGLKSVLRKGRHGTRSQDSLELEPLTSISSQTEKRYLSGHKGTLCRMKKVKSEENAREEELIWETERRISTGFPLLNKLKILTDKHQNHHQISAHNSHQYEDRHEPDECHHQCYHHQHRNNNVNERKRQRHQHTYSPCQANDWPTNDEDVRQAATVDVGPESCAEPQPLGAGLPLLERLLMLKQKEDTERNCATATATRSTCYSPLTSPTATDAGLAPVPLVSRPTAVKKEVVFAPDVIINLPAGKDVAHAAGVSRKREFRKPWSLLRKATGYQGCDSRVRSTDSHVSASTKYEPICGATNVPPSPSRSAASPFGAHRSLTWLYNAGIRNRLIPRRQSANATVNSRCADDTTTTNMRLREDVAADLGLSIKPIMMNPANSRYENDRNNNNNNNNNNHNNDNNDSDNTNNDEEYESKDGNAGGSGYNNEASNSDCKRDAVTTPSISSSTSCGKCQTTQPGSSGIRCDCGLCKNNYIDKCANAQLGFNEQSYATIVTNGQSDALWNIFGGNLSVTDRPYSASLPVHPAPLFSYVDEDLLPEYLDSPSTETLEMAKQRQEQAAGNWSHAGNAGDCSIDLLHLDRTLSTTKTTDTRQLRRWPGAAVTLTRSFSEPITIPPAHVQRYSVTAAAANDDFGKNAEVLVARQFSSSPEDGETLERHHLKRILKRISSAAANLRIRDVLTRPLSLPSDSGPAVVRSRVEFVRRLMSAPTVEGYVARHSTLEKGVACDMALNSPPAAPFGDQNEDTIFNEVPPSVPCESHLQCPFSQSPNRVPNIDVIRHNSLVSSYALHDLCVGQQCSHCGFDDDRRLEIDTFRHSPSFCERDSLETIREWYRHRYESCVEQFEQQIRERDRIICALRSNIQKLQKHHERCFSMGVDDCDDEYSSDENDDDCDTVMASTEHPFLRDESVDTILLSPPTSRRSWPAFQNLGLPSEEGLESHRLARTKSSLAGRRRSDVRIDIGADETSASETDQLFGQSNDEQQSPDSYDQNWEVRMLAGQLEKRRKRRRRLPSDRSAAKFAKNHLQNTRSLEDCCEVAATAAAPSSASQRSVSTDNVYSPLVNAVRHPPGRTSQPPPPSGPTLAPSSDVTLAIPSPADVTISQHCSQRPPPSNS